MKIGYARVSTADQNLDLQKDALVKGGCEKIFEEKASGRAGSSRPELLAALTYLRPGDVLVVWKLDRLGRSLTEMMKTIDELRAKGIHFQSMTEQLDSESAHGRFAMQIQGAMAEYFLDLNRERTMEGIKAAVARGRKGGRRPLLSPEDQDVARTLIAGNSLSMSQIAKRLNVDRTTLYRYFPGGRIKEQTGLTETQTAVVKPKPTNFTYRRCTGPRDGTTEKDGGVAFHALPDGATEAICGARPKRGGAWGEWKMSKPTCPVCVDILALPPGLTS